MSSIKKDFIDIEKKAKEYAKELDRWKAKYADHIDQQARGIDYNNREATLFSTTSNGGQRVKMRDPERLTDGKNPKIED